MSEPLFKGVMTALVTPFREGRVDEAAFRRLVDRQIENGVRGLVPVGTTGEASTLSEEEHNRVVALCVEAAAGRAAVIAGAGANSTETTLARIRAARSAGAAAALVVTPYYNRPSQEGLYQHFAAAAELGFPIVLYNVPSRTGVDLANETVARLALLPAVVGIKDATGDLGRASLMRLQCGPGFCLLSGDDPSGLGYVAHGGHGVISVTSNVAPRGAVRRIDAALTGDFKTALAWQDRLIKLDRALFADASPGPTKFALAELGLCRGEVRLPMTACAEGVKAQIRYAMHLAGVI